MLLGMSAHEQPYADVPSPPDLSGLRAPARSTRLRVREAIGSVRLQLVALLSVAGALNLWALSRNGWANEYYSAAVRSMSTSWHDFLFASMDRAG